MAVGLVLSFTLGVVSGTLLGRQFGARRPVAVLLLVAGLLAMAGAVHGAIGAEVSGFLMAFAMGAENTVFAKEGQSGIGLTYMTGTLVRLGQRFAEAITGGPWGALGPWNPLQLRHRGYWSALPRGDVDTACRRACRRHLGLRLGAR